MFNINCNDENIIYLNKLRNELVNFRKVVPTTTLAIPLASERVSAGFPSPAADYVDSSLDMNRHLITNPTATFIVIVNSQSMLNAGIDVEDELIVDRSLNPKHRDIVIALIDNDFTVKRLMIEDDALWLKAENAEFKDIHFSDGQQFTVWGVVTRVIKKLR